MVGQRNLARVEFDEELYEEIAKEFDVLMGETNDERKEFFMVNAQYVETE